MFGSSLRLGLMGRVGFILACGLEAAACGDAGTPSAEDGVCEPGATQECVCKDGVGAQVCAADGQSWDACNCGSGSGGQAGWPASGDGGGGGAVGGDAGASVGGSAGSGPVVGECTPGETDSCGNCGTKSCQSDGTWGTCDGEGCKPGNTKGSGCDQESCNKKCEWETKPSCSPGDCKSCTAEGGYTGIKCCLPSSCSWSDQCCVPSGGSCGWIDTCCSGNGHWDMAKDDLICD